MKQPQFYGSMPLNKPIKVVPVTISCSKCNGRFSVEKKHHEIVSYSSVYKVNDKGLSCKENGSAELTYKFCPSCFEKFKLWVIRT